MNATDTVVVQVLEAVAARMTALDLPGTTLRERGHLDPFVKDELKRLTHRKPVSKKFGIPAFGGLGPVDVVAEEPRLLMELKWSYQLPGKVFESLWDAIKLAMLGPEHGFECLYVLTGASMAEWRRAECADLFESGTHDPIEMWARPLSPKRGPNYGATVGDDLVIGAWGNQPTRGPRSLTVRRVGTAPVADGFELRLIRIDPMRDACAWPQRQA